MKLHAQTAKKQFGNVLIQELAEKGCERVNIAVAWVRASGLLHMQTGILDVLARAGRLTVVVGIDGENTSEEGLAGLIGIASAYPKQAELFVRHNEAGSIFHPKLYVFRHKADLRAYIGSNNLTQSGLFQNEELSIALLCKAGDALDKELVAYFDELTDVSTGLTKPLTPKLLKALADREYVKKEAVLRTTNRARRKSIRTRSPLFASVFVRPPKLSIPPSAPVQPQGIEPSSIAPQADWHAVYLRLRLARRTQAQIPIVVAREIRRRIGLPAGDGPIDLKSRVDGTVRRISPALARGTVNTYKFEGAEVAQDPLLQIFPIGSELFFEFLDSANPLGQPVLKFLGEGFDTDPPETHQTTPNRATATWYRFA